MREHLAEISRSIDDGAHAVRHCHPLPPRMDMLVDLPWKVTDIGLREWAYRYDHRSLQGSGRSN